jgi:hypothetical protein
MKHHPEITDDMITIFSLIVTGGEACRLLAVEKIRNLPQQARRDLRAACQETEEILDDVTLAEMRERRPWRL